MAAEARSKNREAAEKVLARAKDARCINADLYKPLIKLYGELEDPEAAEAVIDDMKQTNVLPDASTYGTLLAAHTRRKVNQEAAERVLARAKEEKKVNVQMFSCLMSLYGERGVPEKAELLLADMAVNKVNPDANTYSTLIAAYARQRNVEKAEDVLKRAKEAKCVNADLYKPLMRLYGQMDHSEDPETLLQDMEKNNVKPHASTYATLLAVHARQNNREKAEQVLERAKKACKINAHIYSPLMRLYGELRDSDAAERLLAEMLENNVMPDISIYVTLLQVHATKKNKEGAVKVLHRARECGFAGKQIYKGLLTVCAEQGDPESAEYYLEDLLQDCKGKSQSLTPTSAFYFESVIEAYCSKDNMEGALRVLEKFEQYDKSLIRIDIFTKVMKLFGKLKLVDEARELADDVISCEISDHLTAMIGEVCFKVIQRKQERSRMQQTITNKTTGKCCLQVQCSKEGC